MDTMDVYEAANHLPLLVQEIDTGEEIVISRNGEPVLRVVRAGPRGKPVFGALKGKIAIDDRFFEPLPKEMLCAWGECDCDCDCCSTPTL